MLRGFHLPKKRNEKKMKKATKRDTFATIKENEREETNKKKLENNLRTYFLFGH